MDPWTWQHLDAWLEIRVRMRIGALVCVIAGPTQGRPWSPSAARATLRQLAVTAGVRRRFAPHQLRHAHAIEMAREGVALNVIQRQLGHANLGITSIYLQGIDSSEINDTVHRRPRPYSQPAPDSASEPRPLQQRVGRRARRCSTPKPVTPSRRRRRRRRRRPSGQGRRSLGSGDSSSINPPARLAEGSCCFPADRHSHK